MNLNDRFLDFIRNEQLFSLNSILLIAVSGGIDSVVLCELCRASNINFSIAHVNFKLRGDESDADASFIQELALKYGVDYFVKEFDTANYAEENKQSIQVAARELRYNWFKSIINPATGKVFEYIATAHHADDNVETILMNFFKGTGINGLKGIIPKHNQIVRPLLFATKEQIKEFADKHNLRYREDSSNSSNKYTRNYFRNELLPAIEKVYPSVKQNIADNAYRFRDIKTLYGIAIDQIIKKLVVRKENEIHIPVLKLEKLPAAATVLYEIIKEYGFSSTQVNEVMKLLQSMSGKYVRSSSHTILRNRKWLIISPVNAKENAHFLVEESEGSLKYSDGELIIKRTNVPPALSTDPAKAQLDIKHVSFPLLLRKCKTGDYFYPLGMKKKKKLSRFFIDQKLSLKDKEKVWVLESNKKIIWIVGHRIDDRFKITPHTKELLEVYRLPSK